MVSYLVVFGFEGMPILSSLFLKISGFVVGFGKLGVDGLITGCGGE